MSRITGAERPRRSCCAGRASTRSTAPVRPARGRDDRLRGSARGGRHAGRGPPPGARTSRRRASSATGGSCSATCTAAELTIDRRRHRRWRSTSSPVGGGRARRPRLPVGSRAGGPVRPRPAPVPVDLVAGTGRRRRPGSSRRSRCVEQVHVRRPADGHRRTRRRQPPAPWPTSTPWPTSADLGVLNTWGAKGIFDWRSRHHWATVGLQARRPATCGGVPDSDLVVLTGIDPDELDLVGPGRRPGLQRRGRGHRRSGALAPLAERWSRPAGGTEPCRELRARLAAVTQAGWARTDAPLAPTQVTRPLRRGASEDAGFVAAAPGHGRLLGGPHLRHHRPRRRQGAGPAPARGLRRGLRRRGRPAPARSRAPLVVTDASPRRRGGRAARRGRARSASRSRSSCGIPTARPSMPTPTGPAWPPPWPRPARRCSRWPPTAVSSMT